MASIIVMMVIAACDKFDEDAFNSPIDILCNEGKQIFANDSNAFLDRDGNGIADYYDHPELYRPKDTIPPTITVLEGDTVRIPFGDPEDKLSYYLEKIRVQDNAGGPYTILAPSHNVELFVTNETSAPYVITYIAQDSSGNIANAYRYVIIFQPNTDDVVAPIITLLDTVYIVEGNPFIDPGAQAWDNVDGTINPTKITKTGTVDNMKVGVYLITYSVSDNAGNVAEKIRTVIVQPNDGTDLIPPQVTLNGEDTVVIPEGTSIADFMNSWVDPKATAIDNRDGDISANIEVSPPQQLSNQYWIKSYTAKDAANNSASVTRVFKIEGGTVTNYPVITLTFPDSTIQLVIGSTGSAVWSEPGYAASDPDDGDLTSEVVVDSSDLVAHLTTIGHYEVIYTVTNTAGLTVQKRRPVDVVDNPYDIVKPEITLSGRNPDTVLVKSSANYVEPGFTAIDNKDGDITDNVSVTYTVNMDKIGKYTATYIVADAATNSTTVKRTIWVVRDTLTSDLMVRYAVPAEDPLPAMSNKQYKHYEIDGEGPDLSVITTMSLSWRPEANTIDAFQLQFSEAVGGMYNIDLRNSPNTFNETGPTLTIRNVDIEGFSGTYYVTIIEDEFIWVHEDGDFAIIWQP